LRKIPKEFSRKSFVGKNKKNHKQVNEMFKKKVSVGLFFFLILSERLRSDYFCGFDFAFNKSGEARYFFLFIPFFGGFFLNY